MAAPVGNQFWKLRSKHGRDKLFETPELMWEAACEYFQWCIDNPFQKAELSTYQGNSTIEQVPVMRPFTLEGVCLYMDASTSYFRTFKVSERAKKEDFIAVIQKIEETIRNQQYSGSASGFLNANIVSRYLGLKDNSAIEHSGAIKNESDIDYSQYTDDELKQLIALQSKGRVSKA